MVGNQVQEHAKPHTLLEGAAEYVAWLVVELLVEMGGVEPPWLTAPTCGTP